MDKFIEENEAFLSHDWAYMSADEIDSGAISKLRPHRLVDIAYFEWGHGHNNYGYVPDRGSSGAELAAVNEIVKQYAPLFLNFECVTYELQQTFDRFFGPGRFDVTTWTGDGDELLVHTRPQWENENGEQEYGKRTLLLTLGLGGGGSGTLIERGDISIEGDKIAVTCNVIKWYEDLGNGVMVCCMDAAETELAAGLAQWVLSYTSYIDAVVYEPASLDSFIKAAGISRERIVPIRLILYRGDDGALHLWGVDRTTAAEAFTPASEASASATQNEAPAVEAGSQPQIVPDALESEVMRTVSASGGLRMRQGPDTNYDYIQMIPDGTRVPSYAERDGWYYVLYAGHYGWVSGDYCS